MAPSLPPSLPPLSLSLPPALVWTIVVVFIAAILYEGLKTLREFLLYFELKKLNPRKLQIQDEKTPLLTKGTSPLPRSRRSAPLPGRWWFDKLSLS